MLEELKKLTELRTNAMIRVMYYSRQADSLKPLTDDDRLYLSERVQHWDEVLTEIDLKIIELKSHAKDNF